MRKIMKRTILSLTAVLIAASMLVSGCFGGGGNANGKNKASDGRPGEKRVEADVTAVRETMENAKAGDRILLGSWEQNNKTSDGAEAISWIVLTQMVGKALVVSEKVLDYQQFIIPGEGEDYRFTHGRYPESDMRKFLSDVFYAYAFSEQEKTLILTTKQTYYYVEDYHQMSVEIEDYVFPLSVDEASRYLTAKGTDIYGQPTDFVKSFDPYMSDVEGVPGITSAITWWLRDEGDNWGKAATVNGYDDKTNAYGADVSDRRGVRPAMWIVYNENDMAAYERGEIDPKPDPELDAEIGNLSVGDIVKYGVFDMNPRMEDGYEDLEWTVLDETGDALLLFMNINFSSSRFMDIEEGEPDPEMICWAFSTIRKVLNDENTLNKLFTPQEKAKIRRTHLVTSGDGSWEREGGPETDDYLFLPDTAELEEYFPEKEARISPNGSYWLRTPAFVEPYMGSIDENGSLYSKDSEDYCGLRLMMWVNK